MFDDDVSSDVSDVRLSGPSRFDLNPGDDVVRLSFHCEKALYLCMIQHADMTFALRAFDPIDRCWRNGVEVPNLQAAHHVFTESTADEHNVPIAC